MKPNAAPIRGPNIVPIVTVEKVASSIPNLLASKRFTASERATVSIISEKATKYFLRKKAGIASKTSVAICKVLGRGTSWLSFPALSSNLSLYFSREKFNLSPFLTTENVFLS